MLQMRRLNYSNRKDTDMNSYMAAWGTSSPCLHSVGNCILEAVIDIKQDSPIRTPALDTKAEQL